MIAWVNPTRKFMLVTACFFWLMQMQVLSAKMHLSVDRNLYFIQIVLY